MASIRLPLLHATAAALLITCAGMAAAQTEPQVVDDSQIHAKTTTVGGASVLPTTRTVPHWYGTAVNPHDGVTYGFNMVGADPNNCSSSTCSVTVEADITPVIVNVAGLTFDPTARDTAGKNVVDAVLASP